MYTYNPRDEKRRTLKSFPEQYSWTTKRWSRRIPSTTTANIDPHKAQRPCRHPLAHTHNVLLRLCTHTHNKLGGYTVAIKKYNINKNRRRRNKNCLATDPMKSRHLISKEKETAQQQTTEYWSSLSLVTKRLFSGCRRRFDPLNR